MSLSLLLTGSLLIAIVFLWFARAGKHEAGSAPASWNLRLIGGAVIMLALAGFLGYGSYRQHQAPVEIEKFIAAYPNAAGLMWVPEVGDGGHWLLETGDSLKQVGDFYEQYSKAERWRLDRTEARDLLHLRMRRQGLTVTIIGTSKEGRSQLVYQVKEKNKKRS